MSQSSSPDRGARSRILVVVSLAASVFAHGLCFTTEAFSPVDSPPPARLLSYSAPALLDYQELASIDTPDGPAPALRQKINDLLNIPFVSNEAHLSGTEPVLSRNNAMGKFIRVAFWNIERGLRLDDIKLALEAPDEFLEKVKLEAGNERYVKIAEEIEVLRSADILAINEADLGMKRTGYRDVTRDLAAALKMNYVYGVEFIEIDPLNMGTELFAGVASSEKRAELRKVIEVDTEQYRGLHGAAILSRFPIKQARVVPLETIPYDWYRNEKKKLSVAEAARRRITKVAFSHEIPREIRYGGRSVLIAELHIPDLPEGSLTVVTTHLEDRCKPSERRKQVRELLTLIKGINGPLVLTGDFNTSGVNNAPTSIRTELMKRVRSRSFWAKQALKAAVSLGPAFDFLIETISFARTLQDPTATSIFVFAPNKEADLFRDIERMRFDDGFVFDFRGDSLRTVNGTSGTLANSNHRSDVKGFVTTAAARRTYWGVGKSKVDWIFVKAFARHPRRRSESYRLAPHFPRTMERFNHSLGERLSDHNPIVVDLPLEAPTAEHLAAARQQTTERQRSPESTLHESGHQQ